MVYISLTSNIGDDVFTVSKHWKRVVSHPDSSQSHQAHLTMLQ